MSLPVFLFQLSDVVKFFSFSVAKMFLNSTDENGTQIVIHYAVDW